MDKLIMLDPSDYVGVSFWLISAAMVAATFFFWVERDRAIGKWKTSLTVAAMVTGIAAIHYFYMREVFVVTGESPTVLRYDWLLTVPLQIIEFYLILSAIAVVKASLFWRLLIASLLMLVTGYLGEVNADNSGMLWDSSLSERLPGCTSSMKSLPERRARSAPTRELLLPNAHSMPCG